MTQTPEPSPEQLERGNLDREQSLIDLDESVGAPAGHRRP